MNDLSIFGLEIVFLLIIWKKTIRKAALDHYRDRLFDLRDEARSFFLHSPSGLSDPAYRFLRNQINDCIRFLKRGTLTRSLMMRFWLSSRPDLVKALDTDIERRFHSEIPEITQFCMDSKRQMNRVIREYIFRISLFGNALLLLKYIFERFEEAPDDKCDSAEWPAPSEAEIGVIRRVTDPKMHVHRGALELVA